MEGQVKGQEEFVKLVVLSFLIDAQEYVHRSWMQTVFPCSHRIWLNVVGWNKIFNTLWFLAVS